MLFHFTDIVLCTSPLTSSTVIPNHFYTQAVLAHFGFDFILDVYAYEKKINLNANITFDLMYTAMYTTFEYYGRQICMLRELHILITF